LLTVRTVSYDSGISPADSEIRKVEMRQMSVETLDLGAAVDVRTA
jgi:hypothetical protein